MIASKDDGMGRFSVTVDLANYDDIVLARAGDLAPERVRRTTLRGVVVTGAARLVLPESVVRSLGVTLSEPVTVRYADGRCGERPMATGVELTYAGRRGIFDAVVEPDRDSALIGAIVLESLDFVVDCTGQHLVPRDPRRIISEIE